MTIVDEQHLGEAGGITEFVTLRSKNIMIVPGGSNGDEVWVSNIDEEIYAISAEACSFGEIRKLSLDRPINRIVVFDDRLFLLPTWGRSVLVLDLKTEVLLAEIPIGSIPVRALAAHDLIWVSGDGDVELLTVIDPKTLMVSDQFKVGSNSSNTNGPQQPFTVGNEVWVPNRGDNAFFVARSTSHDPCWLIPSEADVGTGHEREGINNELICVVGPTAGVPCRRPSDPLSGHHL